MGQLRLRIVPASGGLAAAAWLKAPGDTVFRANSLHLLSGSATGLSRLDVLMFPALFPRFGLPATLD